MAHHQFAPRRAFRAARRLAADPDDLPQVFTLIEALSGTTLERVRERLAGTDSGRRMLESRPDIVDLLADREALARLPEGTLGRAYLDFVGREKISADGIRDAGKKGTVNDDPLPDPLDWVHARMRDTHDLWHAAVGYSGDVLGEVALLAFTFAQTWNPAIALMVVIGLGKTLGGPKGGVEARKTILDGFRRGLRAAWLPAQEWESLLALPVKDVRRLLSLGAPPVYPEIRSYELKARAA
ncbi:MAG TPA: Coq4 family protein [Polyangiaceae bacterium]|jgi:ubiquinone biosynthesis protein COQ4